MSRKTGLGWLCLLQVSRNRQRRSQKRWGCRPGESGGCYNSHIVRAGMRKLKISSEQENGGGKNVMESLSWSPTH